MKRIFTYWVSLPGHDVPPYVQLCLQTWFEHIPDLELVIINHENIREWVGDIIDMRRFRRLTLPIQSDVMSFLLLAKHGGIFMDADTIITRDIFEVIADFDPEKFIVFGYGGTLNTHMAIMMSLKPDNKFMTSAADVALKRLRGIPVSDSFNLPWSYFGNDIIHLAGEDTANRECVSVIDRTESGNILESHYFTDKSTIEQYLTFYFSQHDISLEEAIKKIKFGAISLHNSWTPDEYKKLSFEEVIDSNCMLSAILRYSLADFLAR